MDNTQELPLLLPLGMTVSSDNAGDPEDEIEIISTAVERVILNEFIDRRQSTPDPFVYAQDTPEKEVVQDPTEALCTLLERIVEKLQFRNNGKRTITKHEARYLCKLPEVVKMFERTTFLADIDVTKFSTCAEQTTCFLINLANLIWIHALLFSDQEIENGLLFRSWPLRQIFFNSVGYKVGQLGFVSLYDLHVVLFNLPPIFRTTTLSTLNVLVDPRVHFLLAQPNAFSPKIEVVYPDTLEKLLEDSKNDYLRKFIVVKDMKLYLPMPLLVFVERVSYDQSPNSEVISTWNGDSEKQNILTELLRSKGLPYEKLLSQDIYLVTNTQFKIKFSHSLYELEEMVEFKTSVWRGCRVHRSLYHCFTHHTNIVRSTMLDNHLSRFACVCSDKTSEFVCNNNTLLTMAKIFDPLLNKFSYDTDYSHKGLRCLYANLSFSAVPTTHTQPDEEDEFRYIYKIVESDFMRIPTACICGKIKMCLKVLVSEYDMHLKWPRWYDVYFADANVILNDIVEHGNAALACMWVAVQMKYDDSFKFSDETNDKFYSLLMRLDDTSYVKHAFAYTKDLPAKEIIDSLISSQYDASKLIDLVWTVLNIEGLSEEDKEMFYGLLVGLKMISCIEENKRTFYYRIAYNPLLVTEQLILNKKIALLKEVLTNLTPFLQVCQQGAVSRDEIDELLRTYAEKALHFRRATSPAHCKYAALMHASIFKDGDTFYPPEKIPTEEEWVPNNWVEVCSVCQKEFSVFTRRHHCRRCGRVVCNWCSTRRLKLSIYDSPQRVCEPCFNFESRFGFVEDDSDQSTCTSGSGDEKKPRRPCWMLDTDATLNEYIRNQAIFDTAPDIELCLSLLELHTENNTVPRFLLANAKTMLKILRQRLVCPANFDYPEVAHIVRSLLLAARVYYAHLGDVHGARQCEELTNESVMLNRLAMSKFSPLQPNKPIRDIQDWKQIRNILLEQQNWELALEISTKNGLECESIWYLWAMSKLKSGDWPTARDKFARSNLKKNANMLDGIMEILYLEADKETSKGFVKFFQSNTKKTILPERVFEECSYYLKMYGSGDQLFDFYIENERTFEAVQAAFAKKILPKKFLNKIYIPHLKIGEQVKILKYMENVDLTLIGWKDYVHEICIYCSTNKHFNALYGTQLWLKDYYRAALSCTMFYKMQAKSYLDLAKNKQHLTAAISHFEMAIFRLAHNENTKLEQVVHPRRIEKYIKTVNLQLQVAEVICENTVCAAREFETVPTLFGGEKERLDVILLILDACDNNLKRALTLSRSVISSYMMDTKNVYKKVALRLMEMKREGEVIKVVKYVKEMAPDEKSLVDGICDEVLRAKPQKPDPFIDCISDDILKFNVLVECGYLKSAYMLATKIKRREFVEKVLAEATRLNKPSVERICRSKLQDMM